MKEKRLDYELLRLIAIFGVVFNHTQGWGYELYQFENVSRVNYVLSLVLGILCKAAVPLFFLVSGGLLLQKNEPVFQVLRKRVLRIGVVLVLFSGILFLFWVRWGYVSLRLGSFLRRLWAEGISAPYWYLYTYLGFLLMLPLLRPMVQRMEDRAFVYLAAVHVVLNCICGSFGILSGWGRVNPDLMLPLAESSLFYFIMGYYLAHRFPWELMSRRWLQLLWIAAGLSVLGMYFLSDLSFRRGGTPGIFPPDTMMIFPVFALYALVHQACMWHRVPDRLAAVISALGGCVFGTYLLEGILRHSLTVVYEALQPHIHTIPACLVWVASVVVCGLALTFVLKKLPVFRKLL